MMMVIHTSLQIRYDRKHDLSDVKIADFGLSDFYRPGAVVKTNCGTLSYLAPEVFRGEANAGTPLDVWSLGVILYAMLARKLPFEGNPLNGPTKPIRENILRSRILKCQYPMESHFSPEFRDLLQRLLCDDPMERATMPEILNHPWMRNQPMSTSDRFLYAETVESQSSAASSSQSQVPSSGGAPPPNVKPGGAPPLNVKPGGAPPPNVKQGAAFPKIPSAKSSNLVKAKSTNSTVVSGPVAPGGPKGRSPRASMMMSPSSPKKRDAVRSQTLSTK